MLLHDSHHPQLQQHTTRLCQRISSVFTVQVLIVFFRAAVYFSSSFGARGLVKMGSFGFTLPSTVVLIASRRTSLMLFEFFFAYSSRSLCSASVRVVCTTFMLHHE